MGQAVMLGDPAGERALAGGGRAVDGDDEAVGMGLHEPAMFNCADAGSESPAD
jgi:hypothetical protein